jgi:hypothetical protein
MRKILSHVLIGLGAFLLLVGVLVKFYAYPNLAKVPVNYESTTLLSATGATILDPATLKEVTTDLSVSSHTQADSSQDWPGGAAVWVVATTISRPDGSVFQQTTDRVPFDRVSGAGTACDACNGFEQVPGPGGIGTKQIDTDFVGGEVLKFPFNTQQHDYPVWDDTLGKPVTAVFSGVEKLQGMRVYKFVQTVEPTDIGTQDVPGSLFGSKLPSVTAQQSYQITRTFYIDPVTGGPMNRIDDQVQTLTYNGKTVTAFSGSVGYTPDQVSSLISDTKPQALFLGAMRLTIPLIAWVVGLMALVGGLLLRRRSKTTASQVSDRRRPMAHA